MKTTTKKIKLNVDLKNYQTFLKQNILKKNNLNIKPFTKKLKINLLKYFWILKMLQKIRYVKNDLEENKIKSEWKWSLKKIKNKLNIKKLYLIKNQNKKIFLKKKAYILSFKNYRKIIKKIKRKKILYKTNKHFILYKTNFFLQYWIMKILKKNINFNLIDHSSYQFKKKWYQFIKKRRIKGNKKKNIYMQNLTKTAINLKRYYKYNELLYLCQKELEKKKKGQHGIIRSFYNVMHVLKPWAIRSFKIRIQGKINAVNRTLKITRNPNNREIPMQQYNKDIDYHEIQARCRTGTFGLNIWIEHFSFQDKTLKDKIITNEQISTKKN